MREIRIHGRGGQGNVTAADLLAVAIFEDGKYTQAFPFFGSERMGAPVTAFVRIDDKKIRARNQVRYPDYVIVQDPTLLGAVNVFEGLKSGGIVVINSEKDSSELDLPVDSESFSIPAFKIAREVIGRPIPNTVLLGAFAAASGEVSLEAIKSSIERRFPGDIGEKNTKAADQGYNYIKERLEIKEKVK